MHAVYYAIPKNSNASQMAIEALTEAHTFFLKHCADYIWNTDLDFLSLINGFDITTYHCGSPSVFRRLITVCPYHTNISESVNYMKKTLIYNLDISRHFWISQHCRENDIPSHFLFIPDKDLAIKYRLASKKFTNYMYVDFGQNDSK